MITYKMIVDRLNRETVYRSREYWDELAATSYGEKGTLLYKNPHLNELFHSLEGGIVHGWCGDIAGKRLLDIGCGAGRYCREFAQKGALVDGIDFSSKSIEVAKTLSSDSAITYSVGSIYDLDSRDTYDWVVCSRVLAVACKDADDVRKCLDRIKNSLRPGGKVIFIEPTHRSIMRRVLKLNLREFHEVLHEAGFRVLETKCAEFYPSRMVLAYIQLPKVVTQGIFRAGEVLARAMPRLTDQKFVLAGLS